MSAGPGRFVVLEGIDGSGTTTQAARLAASLRALGHAVVSTREPSDGPIGVLIRQALTRRLVGLSDRVLALLFAADRLDHLASVVEPALAEGKVVVSDRYVLSSLAYQGMRLPLAWVEALNAAARPADLTLFLEVDPRTAARRRHGRGGTEELFDADEVQRAVARAYGRVARKHARAQRVVRVDGRGAADEVAGEILRRVRAVLPRRRRK
jgi:dTMP kinase